MASDRLALSENLRPRWRGVIELQAENIELLVRGIQVSKILFVVITPGNITAQPGCDGHSVVVKTLEDKVPSGIRECIQVIQEQGIVSSRLVLNEDNLAACILGQLVVEPGHWVIAIDGTQGRQR